LGGFEGAIAGFGTSEAQNVKGVYFPISFWRSYVNMSESRRKTIELLDKRRDRLDDKSLRKKFRKKSLRIQASILLFRWE
jgi:hypothetical protein